MPKPCLRCFTTLTLFVLAYSINAATPVDAAKYDPACGIKIESVGDQLHATWNTGAGSAKLSLNLAADAKLLAAIALAPKDTTQFTAIIQNADIEFPVTVGSRTPAKNQLYPYVFFDNPNGRAHETFPSRLELKSATVESAGTRAAIRMATLSAGPFTGELVIHLYDGSPLIHVEAVLTPTGNNIAYIYDALITGGVDKIAYEDLQEKMQSRALSGDKLTKLAVRYRTLIGQTATGSLAIFPPPHAFFFPRDLTNNLSYFQFDKTRFGIRQDPSGGGNFVPWIDAYEGKAQRMHFFLIASTAQPKELLEQVKRYTHGDTFKPMDGRLTFTSHYHSRLAVGEMAGKSPVREFAYVFKRIGVNIVHLSEFHGDGHIDDLGPVRFPEMKAMFDLCRGYSDEKILLLPGEEGNKYLAHPWPADGKVHPGHWMYLLPKHIYLTWKRTAEQPFSEEVAPYGKVYHIGSRDDMIRLLKEEKGLAWSAHPRIKASFATPDAFKDQDFYKSDIWLGAAWKAMPADLSEPRLGTRCLDLLDDMSNWATAGNYPLKALPGEVDVFEIDRNHELYGHMNINYLNLAKAPEVGDCTPVIDVLRKRDFFTTTGEILIYDFRVENGICAADIEWTFPLGYMELISGDGKSTQRQRIDTPKLAEFGRQKFSIPVDAKTAKWIRLEVIDIARNTAYTQAVEIK